MVTVDLPLLDELRLADRELIAKFPGDPWDVGLASLGLRLYETFDEVRYPDVTPLNCVTFGGSGGDGAHNGLFINDGRVTDLSFVVMTMPADGGFSFIAGETLADFLSLSIGCGSFALADVSVRDSPISLLPHNDSEVGEFPDQRSRDMLAWVAERLQLSPWADKLRYHNLQDKFLPMLQMPIEDE